MMEFQKTTLGAISKQGRGFYGIGAPAVAYSDELYTYLRITDINDDGTLNRSDLKSVSDEKAKEYILQPNDIVFARTGASTGRNYFYDGSDGILVYAGFLIKFSIDEKLVNPRYVKYYCLSQEYKDWIAAYNTGSTRGNINAQTLASMPIILPSRKQQDNIVTILDIIESKRKNNIQINENIEKQAREVFNAWFVFSENRENWQKGTFSDLIVSTLGGDWGKESPSGKNTEMVYCIRGADIPEVKMGNKGKMPTRYILPNNYTAKRLLPGDLVVEISGGSPTQSTGRIAAISQSLLDRYDKGMVCTNFCRAIKPKPGYSMFIYYYWQYLYDRNVFFSYENGTTGIKNLDINGVISTEEIIIPPPEDISKFDEICQTVFNTIFANGLENERLLILRDSLLPRFISGEVDLSQLSL